MAEIDNGKAPLKPDEDYEVLSAVAFPCTMYNADCPYCGNMEEIGVDEPEDGLEIECGECEKVFRIGKVSEG